MRRREAVAVGLVVLGIFAAYAWSGHFWIDVVDEGYFLDLADRTLNGALPYRDFSSYYTPGVFYLFALVFKVFGTSLLPIRVLMAGLRAASALLMYGLARRVAPAPVAWLPFALVAAVDHWPIEPEPHPSWPALVAALLTLELTVRHLRTCRPYWLVLAGASAGLGFAFKQNVGAFTAISLAAYVLLRPSARRSGKLHVVQLLFGLLVVAAVTGLMWPNLDFLSAGALWLPVVASLGLVTWQAQQPTTAERRVLRNAALSASGFASVTAAWLVPLMIAIGPDQTPIGMFLGLVEQSNLAIPLLPVSLATLHLYLPVMALGAALAAQLRPSLQRPNAGEPMPWYALFGSLAALSMYPRADTAHSIVAGPLALVAGTSAFARAYRSLNGDAVWRKVALVVAMLILPLTAIAPQLAWRFTLIVAPEGGTERLAYEPLGLTRAPVLVPRQFADDTRGVVEFVHAGTQASGALFVYPAAPLINFLADRPNPTRFDHFLPGTLRGQDLELTIQELEQARPRYVVWDHRGVVVWETDPANRPLSDYVWRCYEQVTAFNLYLVLERRSQAC